MAQPSNEPCKKEACDIQACLSKNNFDPNRVRPKGPPRSSYRILPRLHGSTMMNWRSRWPDDVVRVRYERLRSMAGRAQTVNGRPGTNGDRRLSNAGGTDPRATGIFVWLALTMAFVMYLMSFQVMVLLGRFYLMRNGQMPSTSSNFFKRLPAKTDALMTHFSNIWCLSVGGDYC